MKDPNFSTLNEQEKEFCELFVNGEDAGDVAKCYAQVFGSKNKRNATRLIRQPDIRAYIESLESAEDEQEFESKFLRRKITNKLMKIADACAEDEYRDRKGNPISPASLRSVAVHAYKLISDINGISKKNSATENGKGGNDSGKAGIVFNVVMPSVPENNVEPIEQPKQ